MDETEPIAEGDDDFRQKIDNFRVDIVQVLDLERAFVFSYLRSKSVLDEEDCEIIMNSGAGRKQKVAKFLDVLACKGPDGYKHFTASLEIEYPQLFEKITGKKPKKCISSVTSLQRFSSKLWTKGPAEKEWIDFDREFLSQRLENTTAELQSLTYVYNKLMHEKNSLEKKVLQTSSDLESQQEHVKDLQEQLKTTKSRSLPGQMKSIESMKTIQTYVQELMAENADKGNRIITLQESLLEIVGKSEKDKLAFIELQRRHEDVLQQLRDVTINYDWERRNSIKMTEKMRKQTDQIKQGDDLRREIFELKLRLSEMREERDEAKDELREFKNVTEALNAKFDCVCEEKQQAVEFREACSSTVIELSEEKKVLDLKLQEAYLDLNDAKRKNMRLSQECKTLREQRDVLLQERESMINERICAEKERDEAIRIKYEMQRSRDESIEAQLRINKLLHNDYCKLQEEMDVVRKDLRMITEQNERQRQKIMEFENAKCMEVTQTVEASNLERTGNVDAEESADKGPSFKRDIADMVESTPKPFPWRGSNERSSTAILNSAYRRIQEKKPPAFMIHRGSLPSFLESFQYTELEDVSPISKEKREDVTQGSKSPGCNGSSNRLKINVTAARALMRSTETLVPTADQRGIEGQILTTIMPAITDFSLKLAMKTGSQESLDRTTERDTTDSPVDHLKSSDKKHRRGKSVSPRVLYKVDKSSSSVFTFAANAKDTKKSETSNETSVNACGKQGRKSKPTSLKKKRSPFNQGRSLELPLFFRKSHDGVGARRSHSSGDLTALIDEDTNSSAAQAPPP